MEVGLDFDDILITPKRTKISSRSEVDLNVLNNSFFSGIPLFVANMDGIGTMEVAKVMTKNNMFTCLVKTYSASEIIDFFRTEKQSYYNVAMSIGISGDDIIKLHKVMSELYMNYEIQYLCVDVANGYMDKFVKTLKYIKEHYPNLKIIAGNVATADGVEQIAPYISACKVGLGSGALCFEKDTLVKTNNGNKKISDLNIGDMVQTHMGNYKPVINKFINKTSVMMEINGIKCTPDHKFYVVKKCDKNKITDSTLHQYAFWLEAKNIDTHEHLLVKL